MLTPGGTCYGICGGFKQTPGGGVQCGCDPECVAFNDCCDDICDDCADIIPECVDASGSTVCGWESAKGWYDCMTTPVPGPSTYPMDCSYATSKHVCVPNCAGKSCGLDGCGSVCGECLNKTKCTLEGQCVNICTPSCAATGNVCGLDGCGGSCGHCGSFWACVEGQCAPLTIDDPPEESPLPDTTIVAARAEEDIAETHDNNNNSGDGSFAPPSQFIIPYEEPGVKVEESTSCSMSSNGESAFIVWTLFCLGLLYVVRRKKRQ